MPKIAKFLGRNNTQRPELCAPGFYQSDANVLITNDGTIKRRSGLTAAAFGRENPIFFESYLTLNSKTYFSNSGTNGIIVGGVTVGWGVARPEQPTAANAGGTGDPGTYLVSLTFALTDGQESGASPTVAVDVTTGGISLTGLPELPADERIIGLNIYISAPNGEAGPKGTGLHRARTLISWATGLTISDLPAAGKECATLGLAPMPAGKYCFFYRGRLYVALGNFLVYSEPWNYEYTNLAHNFLPFEGDVTSAAPVENGIWVGTTRNAMFLAGTDPQADGGFQIKSVVNEPCLTGSVTVDQDDVSNRLLGPGRRALFVLADGVYVGDSGGTPVNFTKHWSPDSSTPTSTGCLMSDAHGEWYVFPVDGDLYAFNLANSAVTRFLPGADAVADLDGTTYVANLAGVWSHAGESDDGTPIAALFSKSGINFNSNMIMRFTSVYFHMRSSGNLSIIVSGTTGTGTVALYDNISTMHGSRAKLPRGVQGRNLTATVLNNDGAFFEIAEADFITEVTSRHARQTA